MKHVVSVFKTNDLVGHPDNADAAPSSMQKCSISASVAAANYAAISMHGYRIGASVAAGDSAALSMQGCILVTSVATGDSAALPMQGCILVTSVAAGDSAAISMQVCSLGVFQDYHFDEVWVSRSKNTGDTVMNIGCNLVTILKTLI